MNNLIQFLVSWNEAGYGSAWTPNDTFTGSVMLDNLLISIPLLAMLALLVIAIVYLRK